MNIHSINKIIILCFCTLHTFAQVTGTFVDKRDGKKYKTLEVNQQIWMAENLAYKAKSGCWVYNNDPKKNEQYGYLYNWATGMKSCPSGWHMANDADWQNLAKAFGGESKAGAKMKSVNGWTDNEINTNSSGFNGLPAGYYMKSDNKFKSMGSLGVWWTATMREDDLGMTVWSFMLGSKNEKLVNDHVVFTEADGLSVRCVTEVSEGKQMIKTDPIAFPKGCKVKLIKDESPFDLLIATKEEQYGIQTEGIVIEDLKPLGDGWYSGSVKMNQIGWRNFKKAKFELIK